MKTGEYLEILGFSHSRIGFRYAEEAIEALLSGYDGGICELYEQIGARHGAKRSAVERGIRTALSSAIGRNPEFYQTLRLKWFAPGAARLRNNEFLRTATYRLKKMEAEE